MRRSYLAIVLCIFSFSNIYSQKTTNRDSLTSISDSIYWLQKKIDYLKHKEILLRSKIEGDTTHQTLAQKKAEKIFGSLFGESKQLSNADSLIREFDNQPSFGMYRDNYIITGTELLKKKDKWNSDVKFQISVRQRLTNSVLPFKTHIFLTYTQRAFWDIYRESFPFRDLTFNPGIGIGRPLVYNNRLLGTLSLDFEHESNGKDGEDSRSWNKIGASALFVFRDRWIFQSKLWIPFVDGEYNRDLTSYAGYGFAALTYSSLKKKYNLSCVITKRAGAFFDANVQLNFSVRMFSNEDLYLFLEYYDGYGECLLNYNEYRQRVRIGLSLKSNLISIF